MNATQTIPAPNANSHSDAFVSTWTRHMAILAADHRTPEGANRPEYLTSRVLRDHGEVSATDIRRIAKRTGLDSEKLLAAFDSAHCLDAIFARKAR